MAPVLRKCIEDLSNAKEREPIPVYSTESDVAVAYLRENFEYIEKCEYPQSDAGPFLCCDCTDDCTSASCKCRGQTELLQKRILENVPECMREQGKDIPIGYTTEEGKTRLQHPNHFAIFECNAKCKCKRRKCLNRVAQKPLKSRLQIYKTSKMGFGVRCLNKIKKGDFIATYTGIVRHDGEHVDDRDTRYYFSLNPLGRTELLDCWSPASHVKLLKDEEEFLKEHPEIKAANIFSTLKKFPRGFTHCSVDAKPKGNVARFFNHSCDPNLFVQYVYTEQDLGFPVIAMFAKNDIEANQPLTIDYSYGELPWGMENIKCQCGAGEGVCREWLHMQPSPWSKMPILMCWLPPSRSLLETMFTSLQSSSTAPQLPRPSLSSSPQLPSPSPSSSSSSSTSLNTDSNQEHVTKFNSQSPSASCRRLQPEMLRLSGKTSKTKPRPSGKTSKTEQRPIRKARKTIQRK